MDAGNATATGRKHPPELEVGGLIKSVRDDAILCPQGKTFGVTRVLQQRLHCEDPLDSQRTVSCLAVVRSLGTRWIGRGVTARCRIAAKGVRLLSRVRTDHAKGRSFCGTDPVWGHLDLRDREQSRSPRFRRC